MVPLMWIEEVGREIDLKKKPREKRLVGKEIGQKYFKYLRERSK